MGEEQKQVEIESQSVKHKIAGFTLIEMSIVLVIVGLIIGGILVGTNLIQTAQIRATIKQLEQYRAAINTFKVTYNALPGDMPNATQFWGADISCPNTPYDGTPKTATCDGNGDGQIGIEGMTTSSTYEDNRFWQHLANAGFIEGKYNGVNSNSCKHCSTPPFSSPLFKGQSDKGFNLYGTANSSGAYMNNLATSYAELINSPSAMYYSIFWIGPIKTPGTNMSGRPAAFTTQWVYSLDNKIDDGLPYKGTIQISAYLPDGIANCATTQSLTATYQTNISGINCDIMWNEKLP